MRDTERARCKRRESASEETTVIDRIPSTSRLVPPTSLQAPRLAASGGRTGSALSQRLVLRLRLRGEDAGDQRTTPRDGEGGLMPGVEDLVGGIRMLGASVDISQVRRGMFLARAEHTARPEAWDLEVDLRFPLRAWGGPRTSAREVHASACCAGGRVWSATAARSFSCPSVILEESGYNGRARTEERVRCRCRERTTHWAHLAAASAPERRDACCWSAAAS